MVVGLMVALFYRLHAFTLRVQRILNINTLVWWAAHTNVMAALDNQDANVQLRTRANQEQAACIYVGNIPSKVIIPTLLIILLCASDQLRVSINLYLSQQMSFTVFISRL